MKPGFSLPTAGDWATPENQLRVARQAEALGYHSLWVSQIPRERVSTRRSG
jgi:alkanesulfonate monooxygenase SsuD/methylene tetrahydromethanopterin reductase-like flavin-dependent oxidoreductase (luciferase family)